MELVESSHSFREILTKLGYKTIGGQHKILKLRLAREGIDTAILETRARAVRSRKLADTAKIAKRPAAEVYCKNSSFTSLRARVLKEGWLPYTCSLCPIESTHNGLPLSLQLDHVNGDNTDNRKSNLRWVCPNCHSQTATYAGKRLRKQRLCPCCNTPLARRQVCNTCRVKRASKVNWPTVKQLQRMVDNAPVTKVAEQIGVSDVLVWRHLKAHNITPLYSRSRKITWPPTDKVAVMMSEAPATHVVKALGVSDWDLRNFCKQNGIKGKKSGEWNKIWATPPNS